MGTFYAPVGTPTFDPIFGPTTTIRYFRGKGSAIHVQALPLAEFQQSGRERAFPCPSPESAPEYAAKTYQPNEGGCMPKCSHARAVACRPFGVRMMKPWRMRKGSYTSSTVSGSSERAAAKVVSPTGRPEN